MKLRLFLGLVIISVIILSVGACAGQEEPSAEPTPPPAAGKFTEEESRQIALEFLTNSPTYLFDGMSETVELIGTTAAEYPNSWTFVYEFQSRQAGYGDRTDQMLAQVITPHQAAITVQDGNVTQAIMDETWDMIFQSMIVTEEASRQIAEDFLKNSPTYLFDGIEGSIKLTETLEAFCPYCWGFVFECQSRHAGYGDRTGQILAEVITTHEAIISVSGGKVDGGTIDGKWDMVKQEEVAEPQIQTAEHK